MRLHPLISFEYAITKPLSERWRYSTPFLVAFAILSLVGFTTLNIFLVGYNVISISSSNFNASQHLSWMNSLQSRDFSCQQHSFQLGDSFRTNISAFSYNIFNVISSNPDAIVQGSFSYANNTLESCDATQFELVVSPGDRLITANAIIDCPLPLGFQATASWSRSNHPVTGLVPASMFPENSLPRSILDALGNFGWEACQPIFFSQYATKGSNAQKIYKLRVEGQPSCNSPPSASCTQERPNLGRTLYNAIAQSNLEIISDPNLITADVGTVYNLLEVFYAALRIDLRHWTSDNLFTNVTTFNTSISPFVYPGNKTSSEFRTSTLFRSRAATKGLAYVNLTSQPSPDVSTPPAVIQIPYICNDRRRKSPGSFIVSVMAATLSMFLSAWGLVTAILGSLARRFPQANSCSVPHLTAPPGSSKALVYAEEGIYRSDLSEVKGMGFTSDAIPPQSKFSL